MLRFIFPGCGLPGGHMSATWSLWKVTTAEHGGEKIINPSPEGCRHAGAGRAAEAVAGAAGGPAAAAGRHGGVGRRHGPAEHHRAAVPEAAATVERLERHVPTLPSCRCRRLESVDVSGESGCGTSGGSVQSQTDSAAVVLSAHEQVNLGRWKDSVDS